MSRDADRANELEPRSEASAQVDQVGSALEGVDKLLSCVVLSRSVRLHFAAAHVDIRQQGRNTDDPIRTSPAGQEASAARDRPRPEHATSSCHACRGAGGR